MRAARITLRQPIGLAKCITIAIAVVSNRFGPRVCCGGSGADELFWFENDDDALGAMARGRELKNWRRGWKGHVTEEQDPGWVVL
jgi:hypothetical protein